MRGDTTTGGRRAPRPARSSSRGRRRRIQIHLPPRPSSSAGGAYRDAPSENFIIRTQIDQTPLKRALHRICVRIMKFRARFRYASCARYSTPGAEPPHSMMNSRRRRRIEVIPGIHPHHVAPNTPGRGFSTGSLQRPASRHTDNDPTSHPLMKSTPSNACSTFTHVGLGNTTASNHHGRVHVDAALAEHGLHRRCSAAAPW